MVEKFAIGQGVSRLEDPRLLRGAGRFLDDLQLPGLAVGYLLRSPLAHGEIKAIETSAAAAMPGVLAVLTGADYAADGLGHIDCIMPLKRRDGAPLFQPPCPPLTSNRVRFVGDPVALMVAETLDRAKDAAERIEIDYRMLPVVTSAEDALAEGAPAIWDDCPDNVCFEHALGDPAAVDAAFNTAAHVVKERLRINRVSTNSMEPRGCIGAYDPIGGRYTLYAGLQTPHRIRQDLARNILGVPETALRVVTNDVGGSFGMKGGTYREYPLVLWAAKRIGRPVKWYPDRSESLQADNHARDNFVDAELALDDNGVFLGLRTRSLVNLGAYLATRGPHPGIGNLGSLAGVYRTPAIHATVTGLFTNCGSTGPYRGAGRPEAAYVIERMVDIAAREIGLDPAELRRRNTIRPDAMPFRTGLVFTYDTGDFERNMDLALQAADHAGFEARRQAAKAAGYLRGLGISNTIEQAAQVGYESAQVRFDPSGTVTLILGSVSHGQGHETAFTQVLAERLGIAPERIRVVEGDTDIVTHGGGTFGSRSAVLAGSATALAADKAIAKGKRIAAHLLEVAEDDIEFEAGEFKVVGTDRRVDFTAVARRAFEGEKLPPEIEPGLDETAIFQPRAPTFPNGCHVAEVEIDPETGRVRIVGYWVVDDVGTVLNPLLLKGQIHGGVAMGAGQALIEDVRYDPATGQLVSGSFMDYCMPRADDLPAFEVESNPVPTPMNPLGVKGAGEAGTVGALPAVVNAVVDGLAPLGINHLDMPLTAERVWRAINGANSKTGASDD
ncbi:MAG: xanthine dehydrogenase family protein molybdopterin-binding subunit [Alphaproteobacteria bacterium]|jgi:carbon-monoxide dehydrogenase large subunit|nr:xanthine dehydrogenase family protein molybdopterin-binding subunit [Alphaproteobacteria bacterium]